MVEYITDYVDKYQFRETDNPKIASDFNYLVFFLSIIAIGGMFVIFLVFRDSTDSYEKSFSVYSSYMFAGGIIGVVALNLYKNRQFAIFPEYYKPLVGQNVLYGFLVFVLLLAIQSVYQFVQVFLSPNLLLEINYIIFASVCEELFFRGFILGGFIYIAKGFRKNWLLFGLILSAGLVTAAFFFAYSHQNYADDIGLLVVVFLSGCVLGLSYIIKKDITIPIFAHFLLNGYVALQMYLGSIF